mmetsp:Transcript_5546/g.11687  ORF Transcript_5546/g.11687 Transcript_5546/m.11687 type:complete len:1444 (+) Transcript_5546:82-4413(+)
MGRVEACPSMEEGLPPIAAMKDDSRQSDSDTEQQHNDYYNSSNVEELRTRLRERDEQLVTLKDDKAGCMRQILDLKDQLYQLQFDVEDSNSAKANDANQWQTKLQQSKRELDSVKLALGEATKQNEHSTALKEIIQTLEKENHLVKLEKESLEKDLEKYNDDSATTKNEEIASLQEELCAFALRERELQDANTQLTSCLKQERENSTEGKQLSEQELVTLRNTIRSKDDVIQSLQSRVEKGQEDMTSLEVELDILRAKSTKQEEEELKKSKEQTNEIGNLWKVNDEMSKIIEGQSHKMEELTSKLDQKKREYKEQQVLLKKREEEVLELKAQLENKADALERSGSESHSRVAALEVKLQAVNEKVDELTASLHEAMEEVDDLQADVVFKDGKIANLERQIEEASSLLSEASPRPPSPVKDLGGNKFARLRKEIENISKERIQLESEHSNEIAILKSSNVAEVAALEKKLEDANNKVESLSKQLKEETARSLYMSTSIEELEKTKDDLSKEVNQIRDVMSELDEQEDAELEELRGKVKGLKAEKTKLAEELKEAQSALISLEESRPSNLQQMVESISQELATCKEQVATSESTLNIAMQKKEMEISDLKSELSSRSLYANELKNEVESLQRHVEHGPSKRNYGMAIDPEWYEPDTISQLKTQVSSLTKEKTMIERELRAKLEARDTTIGSLVLSATKQEANIATMKAEVGHLKTLVETKDLELNGADSTMNNEEAHLLKKRNNDMTMELKQANRNLALVTQELECAKSQLETMKEMPDVQDLAGRLAVSEQALKVGSNVQVKERDAAIANLLQSLQANQEVISNLRMDIDSFKEKLRDSKEENKRLQHESEIFAEQIIEQDVEFEALIASVAEKDSQIEKLQKEVSSSSSSEDIHTIKNLQMKLKQLESEKNRNLERIDEVEFQLEETESKLKDLEVEIAKNDGFELEKLQLELKNALTEKDLVETKLNKQIDSIRKLRNHAVEEFELKLKERDDQIAALEKELLDLKQKIDDDDIFDEVGLDGNQVSNTTKDELEYKIQALEAEIQSLRATTESAQVEELQKQLAESERMRGVLEMNRTIFNSGKDGEIDRLRQELSDAKEDRSKRELDQMALLKKLDAENEEIREEFTTRMREKNSRITALEQTLAAQEQVVGTMSNEMDQLQNGMEKVSIQRRAEIEEMQQELMDYTSKSTKLEREVMTLSMKLDESKLKYKTKVEKLKERISELESESPLERITRPDRDDTNQREKLKEKADHLKWLNTSLKEENEKLKRKLEAAKVSMTRAEEEMQSKSSKNNDKWRTVALQDQVAMLSKRVVELEEEAEAKNGRSPIKAHGSPVLRPSLRKGTTSRYSTPSSSTPRDLPRVNLDEQQMYPDNHELLSKSEEEDEDAANIVTPALPRPSMTNEKDKSKSKSRFGFGKKSSKGITSPRDDESQSTSNYNF